MLDGLKGEVVLVGPDILPAIVLDDDGERLRVRVLGADGGVAWVSTRDCRLAIDEDG